MNFMSNLGFGPRLHGWWRCKLNLMLVMDKFDLDMHDQQDNQGKFSDIDLKDMMAEAKRLDKARIIHGDIKPDNLMKAGEYVRAIDFGFTKRYESGRITELTHELKMGWSDVAYPNTWVKGINQAMLCAVLGETYGISVSKLKRLVNKDVPVTPNTDAFEAYVMKAGRGSLTSGRTGGKLKDAPTQIINSKVNVKHPESIDYLVMTGRAAKAPQWINESMLRPKYQELIRVFNAAHDYYYPVAVHQIKANDDGWLMAQVEWEDYPRKRDWSWRTAHKLLTSHPHLFKDIDATVRAEIEAQTLLQESD